jgi:two-component system sensor histidine kinase ChiS
MKNRRKKTLCFSFLFFIGGFLWMISLCLYSQEDEIRFKHISTDQGLSQVSIMCIHQDSNGFIWIGTLDGLNRFDGYNFKTYKNDPKDPASISDNYIMAICEDNDGNLWIGTNYGGLNKFDPRTEIFTRYNYDRKNPTCLGSENVRCVIEDRYGNIWIGTYGGGLNRFDGKSNRFKCYKYDENNPYSLSDNSIDAIFEDRSGTLWIGTRKGLDRFEEKGEHFILYKSDKNNEDPLDNWVNTVFEDNSGMLWIGTMNGLKCLDRNSGRIIPYKHDKDNQNLLSNNRVFSIFEDSSGILWIGTFAGLNRFDRKTGKFISYTNDERNPFSLSHNDVRYIFEDRSGVLWVGTTGDGLNLYNLESKQFTNYKHNSENPNSLSHNDVYAIYEDIAGILWIGTFGGGLNRLDRKKNEFKSYKSSINDPRSLSSDYVSAIGEDSSGVLWIGTYNGGLNRFNRGIEKFDHYRHSDKDPNSLPHDDVMVIVKDRSGILWLGTNGGCLVRFDPEKVSFRTYKDDGNKCSLSDNRIRAIYEDHSGILWVGTPNGLNRFDPKTGQFTQYFNNIKDSKSLSHNHVSCICEGEDHTLWIGTYGGGLNKLDRRGMTFQSFQEQDGLPSNAIYGILVDSRGNPWLSTNKGISQFNARTGQFRNFEVEDGLQSNEFNALAYFKSPKTGEMFFGGINGFNSFTPGEVRYNMHIPQVVITGFFLSNRPVLLQRVSQDSPLQKPVHLTETLTLTHRQDFFSFEFAALHYASPNRNKYKYRLEGWDKDWIETDAKNRRATYTNLPGRNYVFRVTASNKDGIWNYVGTSVRVKILPPPWKTWWAYTLYALILMLIIYRFLRSKRILARKVDERTKELKNAQGYLVHSEKMAGLGTLVAGVAHEINNPSSFVHTSAYNLENELKKFETFLLELAGDDADEEIKNAFKEKFTGLSSHLNTIKEGTRRINKIVQDLRTFSRSEPSEMKPITLLEGLKITLELVKAQHKDHVEFVNDFPYNPEIVGNSADLNQVFMNIMINACQSILKKQENTDKSEKGTLNIKTREDKEYAVILFQDTGTGMPEAVKQKIFDPFFTTKPLGQGTGLGLSISYGIIKKHKGHIEVDTQEGIGTTITLYLPQANTKKENRPNGNI